MTAGPRRLFPWLVFGFSCALLIGALMIGISSDPEAFATFVFVLANGGVGALIASKRDGHLVGWLLLAVSLCFAAGGFLVTYLEASDGSASPFVALAGNWSFGLGVSIAATFLLLYFPTGKLPSPRWRPVMWLSVVGTVMLLIGVALSPASFEDFPVESPWALAPDSPVALLFEGGGLILVLVAMFGALVSLVMRMRRGDETERRQLKWVMFAVTTAVFGIVGTFLLELANGPANFPDEIENLVTTVGFALIPAAMGLAIFRYRLYEIDRIVSRTVSYAVVVGLLGLVALALAAGMTLFLPSEDPLVVAVVTLAVFALFNPVRRRVQGWVERRFNRSRYDAERVIEDFTGGLRDRVDPEGVIEDWLGVVGSTMQPASFGVWMRQS